METLINIICLQGAGKWPSGSSTEIINHLSDRLKIPKIGGKYTALVLARNPLKASLNSTRGKLTTIVTEQRAAHKLQQLCLELNYLHASMAILQSQRAM